MLSVADNFKMPDTYWEIMEPLIPIKVKTSSRGRKPLELRKVADGIFYVFRTGCQWKAVPHCFGSGSSIHKYFQEWVEEGVFQSLWIEGLIEYDEESGIQWKWRSIDASSVKAPLGGDQTGPNPTDRAKLGTKRSVIVDGNGIPLSLITSGANTHDSKLLEANINNIILKKHGSYVFPDYLLGDKAYDSGNIRQFIENSGLNPKIKRRREEIEDKKKNPKKKSRRWVVERTFSWFNKFRKLLIRWEKLSKNYEGILHFVCSFICFKASGILR
jgi:putative transposase